jgi:3-phenylpropionate/cinnamic acid dioxygenase small subunit
MTSITELDPIQAMTIEREITQTLYRYARAIDEQRVHDWLDMFTDDCRYGVMTYENAQEQGMYLHREDKEGMKLRAAHLLGVWQNPRGKTLHAFSNIEIDDIDGDRATVRSNFIVYRTEIFTGETRFHSCGSAKDVLVKQDGQWFFQDRDVTVDNSLLPPNFTELL